MATLTLRPDSNYSVSFSRSSGTYNYEMVDETSADDDTTYLYNIQIDLVDTFNSNEYMGSNYS